MGTKIIINVRIPLISKLRPIKPNIKKTIGFSWLKKTLKGSTIIKTTYVETMGRIQPAYKQKLKKSIDFSHISEELELNKNQTIVITVGGNNKLIYPPSKDSFHKKGFVKQFIGNLIETLFSKKIFSKPYPILGEGKDKITLQVEYPTEKVIINWFKDKTINLILWISLVILSLTILFRSYISAIRRLDNLSRGIKSLSNKTERNNTPLNLITLEHSSPDEIGELSRSINNLLSKLDRKTKQLQLEIEQKSSISEQIGHEILSPLESLISIVGDNKNGIIKINRIMRAIKGIQKARNIEEVFQDTNLKDIHIIDMIDIFSALCATQSTGVNNIQLINNLKLTNNKNKCFVTIDPENIEDVFDNIIKNAEKHRDNNTPIIVNISRNEKNIKISFYNEGKQIPEKNLDRIFEYGFTTKKTVDNIGFGLFSAKCKITGMGGKIKAKNCKKGVKIIITLTMNI